MEIKFPQILIQLLNFGILLAVITKFLYKPILKILDERAQRIDEGLLAAQKNLEEKARLEEQKKATLLQVEKQAQKVIDEAKAAAAQMTKDAVVKAREEATLAVQKEEAAFKARMAEQEKLLTKNLSQLIILTTKSVLKDSLNTEQQQSIIEHQIKLLDKIQVN
jgi:F-type H+-transporting ATPase subunit b